MILIVQNVFHSIAQTPPRENVSLTCTIKNTIAKATLVASVMKFTDTGWYANPPGIFRQVDENGLQTDEEAVRGDQAEREQTLLIILRRRGVWDVSLAAKGRFGDENCPRRRRRLVVVLVVERPPPRSEEKEDIDRVQRSMVPLSI